jgi:hypothetical protein
MNSRILTSTGLFLIVVGGSNLASATVINFDVDPSSTAIPNGTMIDNTYLSLGVTLSSLQSCPTCSGTTPGDAFAVSVGTFAASSPNVFGIGSNFFLFDSRWGAGVAKFSTGQTDVGIYAASVPFVENLQTVKTKPFLTAYDSSGVFIGSALYPFIEGDAGFGTYQKLIIHSAIPGDIAEVHFSATQPSQISGGSGITYGEFDNLAFGDDVTNTASAWRSALSVAGPGSSPGPDSSVPEPATLLLFGTALMGLGAFKRRPKK